MGPDDLSLIACVTLIVPLYSSLTENINTLLKITKLTALQKVGDIPGGGAAATALLRKPLMRTS